MSLNRSTLALIGPCVALAACAGGGLPASSGDRPTSSMSRTLANQVHQGWISPDAKNQKLVYVSDYTASIILIYPQGVNNPQPIGEILDGISSPRGIAVDATGTLYVVNSGSNSLTVYAPGKTKPKAIIGGLNGPDAVSVDSKDNVYVSESSAGDVLVFKKGKKSPTVTISTYSHPDGLTNDSKSNLFATWNVFSGPVGHVTECKALSNKCTDLGINLSGLASDAKLDSKGNLLIGDSYNGAIDIYPPGQVNPSRVITTTNQGPYSLALDTSDTNLYFADPSNFAVELYTYSTGAQWGSINNGSDELLFVALYPGQKPG